MPLGATGFYGTNVDGTESLEYCTFCYQHGQFTDPDATLEGMIQSSVLFMSEKLGFSEERAIQMSQEVIPNLKRWKQIPLT
jgi:hypothetical protein